MVILQGFLSSFILTQGYQFPAFESYNVLSANFQVSQQLAANFQTLLLLTANFETTVEM